jgi:polyphosphate kinase
MLPVTEKTSDEQQSEPEFLNRELSWLAFASRVIAQAEHRDLPLLERLKFVGIAGMLHDEFFMKRISGLKRQLTRASQKISIDGRTPQEELEVCRSTIHEQFANLSRTLREELLPALAKSGLPVRQYSSLEASEKEQLRLYFIENVMPILTPLAVDSEHPFPFISSLGLNLAVLLQKKRGEDFRFIRIKVPRNRARWVELSTGGFVPLEQVIEANLDKICPVAEVKSVHLFRITRGAEGDAAAAEDQDESAVTEPGSILQLVTKELKARKFAGAVRIECDAAMPGAFRKWLAEKLGLGTDDVYQTDTFLALTDFASLEPKRPHPQLLYKPFRPAVHPRLAGLDPTDTSAIFSVIDQGDLLVHHPYHDFDRSVLRFIESAALDPDTLAIKLTIYRTSRDSSIVKALAEAVQRGKQVAVLVEVTARFDEAPNIAWGRYLEQEGVHVAYGVERLKTHVKLALVVREVNGKLRNYAHVGTGNYHPGTARIYEDLGVLTSNERLCDEIGAVFNALTGATSLPDQGGMLIAPVSMRKRFVALIRREAENATAGLPAGIYAKMNQLQDAKLIRELYKASRAGVPIELNVRGLCCLRPGVPDLSETIRVYGAIGRFLEHSRMFRFENAGEPEYFFGSADWMKRNLDDRVETIIPIYDEGVRRELDAMIALYRQDNVSVWDCDVDGDYTCRSPLDGESPLAVQNLLRTRAAENGC